MAAPAPVCTDAVVIGAGPVGLFQAFQLGLQGLACHIIDALPHPGGQCAQLYGDKPIYDIPALAVCTGQELTDRLLAQLAPLAPHWHLGTQAQTMQPQTDGRILVETSQGARLLARVVVVAAGVGAFVARKAKLATLAPFEGTQVHYAMPEGISLVGQHVVVHGGGEEAVAQVLALAQSGARAPASITLQHRRDTFDAAAQDLATLQALCDRGQVRLATGQITASHIAPDGRLAALDLLTPDASTQRLALDHLIVRLGLVPRLGPLADWGLALEQKQLVVHPATLATHTPGIYAVGDIVHYPGKRKLIVSGFHEATLAAWAAAEWLAQQTLPLEYTTSSERLQRRLGVWSGRA